MAFDKDIGDIDTRNANLPTHAEVADRVVDTRLADTIETGGNLLIKGITEFEKGRLEGNETDNVPTETDEDGEVKIAGEVLNLNQIKAAREQGLLSDEAAHARAITAVKDASNRFPGLAPALRQSASNFFSTFGPGGQTLQKTDSEKVAIAAATAANNAAIKEQHAATQLGLSIPQYRNMLQEEKLLEIKGARLKDQADQNKLSLNTITNNVIDFTAADQATTMVLIDKIRKDSGGITAQDKQELNARISFMENAAIRQYHELAPATADPAALGKGEERIKAGYINLRTMIDNGTMESLTNSQSAEIKNQLEINGIESFPDIAQMGAVGGQAAIEAYFKSVANYEKWATNPNSPQAQFMKKHDPLFNIILDPKVKSKSIANTINLIKEGTLTGNPSTDMLMATSSNEIVNTKPEPSETVESKELKVKAAEVLLDHSQSEFGDFDSLVSFDSANARANVVENKSLMKLMKNRVLDEVSSLKLNPMILDQKIVFNPKRSSLDFPDVVAANRELSRSKGNGFSQSSFVLGRPNSTGFISRMFTGDRQKVVSSINTLYRLGKRYPEMIPDNMGLNQWVGELINNPVQEVRKVEDRPNPRTISDQGGTISLGHPSDEEAAAAVRAANPDTTPDQEESTITSVSHNNPGNIRNDGNDDWQGALDTDREFVQFDELKMGVRASVKVLQSYKNKHNVDTIEKLIGRWAPESENDTDGYIDFVAKKSGIKRDTVIDLSNPDVLRKVLPAMYKFEGWPEGFPSKDLQEGISLGLK